MNPPGGSAVDPRHAADGAGDAPGPAAAAPDPAAVQRAAAWMARLWSDDASEGDRQACDAWRAADPSHETAWRSLQGIEARLHRLPAEITRPALQAQPAPGTPLPRRRLLLGLGLSGLAATYLAGGREAWQIATADLRSPTGEIREARLPDGSQLWLSSATAVELRYDTVERLLLLHAGEILVQTAADPQPAPRPFRVRGRHGSVEALGTRFSLRQDAARSRVTVLEGAVEVRPAQAPGQVLRVEAGQGSVFDRLQAQPPEPAAAAAAAWQRGVLVADGLPLAEVVAELARFRPGWLDCDPAVAGLRVSGVFPLLDTDRALHNLSLALPVSLRRRSRYWVRVQARG